MVEVGDGGNSFKKTPGRIYTIRVPRRLGASTYQMTEIPYDSRGESKKSSSSISVRKWWNSPKVKHKRRVTKYQFYALEGKVKASVKKGFRWIKKACSKLVPGVVNGSQKRAWEN